LGEALVAVDRYRDAASTRRELERVAEQIADRLDDSRRVDVDPERAGHARERQLETRALECGAMIIGGLARELDEIEPLAAELDLAAGDPRDVQQVIDDPCQVRDLALDDLACLA